MSVSWIAISVVKEAWRANICCGNRSPGQLAELGEATVCNRRTVRRGDGSTAAWQIGVTSVIPLRRCGNTQVFGVKRISANLSGAFWSQREKWMEGWKFRTFLWIWNEENWKRKSGFWVQILVFLRVNYELILSQRRPTSQKNQKSAHLKAVAVT